MKVNAKIQKWGNGLALRIAGVMREIPGFIEGTQVEVDINQEGFTVKKIQKHKTLHFPYQEADLLVGLNQETAHADLLVTPTNKEWGENE